MKTSAVHKRDNDEPFRTECLENAHKLSPSELTFNWRNVTCEHCRDTLRKTSEFYSSVIRDWDKENE